ncbi:MAG: hypothetical protein AAF081_19085 [Actinomycetota bacterium]
MNLHANAAPAHPTVRKVIAGLWVVWGLVHAFAGIITMARDTPDAVAGIADGVDETLLAGPYPDAAGAIINQHGWNLMWIGFVTLIAAVYIVRGSWNALGLAALVGGMADIGYFLFLDLGGHVNFVPGTVMTIVSATAIILSGWIWSQARTTDATPVTAA